ncbi:hypothetical protein ACQPYH_10215 [Kribbella sp. CA-245084]|uniref:hypothetical protein n=1 Tax=Kribbella sp. CA-245084 TaxID=3239940 RepID=UPI003D8D0990
MFEGDLNDLATVDLLTTAAEFARIQERAAVRTLEAALAFADRNAVVSGDPVLPGYERIQVYGGDGCPGVAEFAPIELGAVLRMSSGAAASLIGDALALCHRLPRIWAAVLSGNAIAWRARKIAQACMSLSLEAAAIVDRRVVGIVDTVTPGKLATIVSAAVWQADPELAKAQAEAAARARGVFITPSDDHGTKRFWVRAAAGDVIRFDATIDDLARALKTLGDTDSLNQRRAKAIGWISDPAAAHHLLEVARHLARTQPTHTPTPHGATAHDPGPHEAAPPDASLKAPAHNDAAGSSRAESPPRSATASASPTTAATDADAAACDVDQRGTAPHETAPDGAAPHDTPSASWRHSVPRDDRPYDEVPYGACDEPPHDEASCDEPPYGDEPPYDEASCHEVRYEELSCHEPPRDDASCHEVPYEEGSDGSGSGVGARGGSGVTCQGAFLRAAVPGDVAARAAAGSCDGEDSFARTAVGDCDDEDAFTRRVLAGGLAARLAAIKQDAYSNGLGAGSGRARRHTVYVHLTDQTLATGTGVLRVEELGPLLAHQLSELLGHERIVVKPVIDLHDQVSVHAYEIPDRIRERVRLQYPVDMFPYSGAEATMRMDQDHITPYDRTGAPSPPGRPGQTGTHNLIPQGRLHHRAKTFGGWRNRRLPTGAIEWISPHGFTFHVDHTGTHPVPPDGAVH